MINNVNMFISDILNEKINSQVSLKDIEEKENEEEDGIENFINTNDKKIKNKIIIKSKYNSIY